MRTMSIKEYAIAHKMSIYDVVKRVKNKTLMTETKMVDGKNEVMILVEQEQQHKDIKLSEVEESIEDYKKAYLKLKIRYEQLQSKYNALQKEIACKEDN